MKLDHSHEIHRVLGESGKYAIDCAMLEIEDGKGRLIATNGRVLVVLPVEVQEGDEPGLIPAEALGCDRPDGVHPEDLCYFTRELRVSNGRATIERPAGASIEFPAWRKAIPPADATGYLEVRLSARLLYDLSRAMGDEAESGGVRLRIPAPVNGQVRTPIRVDVDEAPGVYGSIMPIIREVHPA